MHAFRSYIFAARIACYLFISETTVNQYEKYHYLRTSAGNSISHSCAVSTKFITAEVIAHGGSGGSVEGTEKGKTDEEIGVRWNYMYSLRRQLMSTVRKPSAHWQRSVLGEHETSLLVKPYAAATAASAATHTMTANGRNILAFSFFSLISRGTHRLRPCFLR